MILKIPKWLLTHKRDFVFSTVDTWVASMRVLFWTVFSKYDNLACQSAFVIAIKQQTAMGSNKKRLPFLLLVCLTIPMLAQASFQRPTTGVDGEQNFDSQVISLFEQAIAHPRTLSPSESPDVLKKNAVLKTILEKFTHHEMLLKNVVYRKDHDTIRVTWGDQNNDYVAKVAYKTGIDTVLSNSLYADKKEVVDVKIMFRTPNAEYDYIKFQTLKNMLSSRRGPPADQTGIAVDYKLSNEKCGFCHTLAKYDGSPSGIFFPRYQESKPAHALNGMSAFFDVSKLQKKNKTEYSNLGLPEMKDDFYFYSNTNFDSNDSDSVKIIRTLIELPQLLEVMSVDNQTSYCILIDTGEMGGKMGFGRNDYICADNVAQRLHVKMTNAMLAKNGGIIAYTEAYFKK